jgi:hypothetical protein
MKRTLSIAAATVLAAALPALAAQITIDTGAPAAGAPAAPAAGSYLASFTPTAADAMLATAFTTDAEVAAIAGIKDVSKVLVRQVKVGNAPDAASVNAIKTKNAADVAKLQAAINANATFKGELSAKMVDPATIVAVELGADGSVTLYALL